MPDVGRRVDRHAGVPEDPRAKSCASRRLYAADEPRRADRREFLRRAGWVRRCSPCSTCWPATGSFRAARAAEAPTPGNPMAPRPAPRPATAKSVIILFMYGGPSQMDLFDPKPELHEARRPADAAGREARRLRRRRRPPLLASPCRFAQHGQSGQWVSELLPAPGRGRRRDRASSGRCTPSSNNHGSALFQMNTGLIRPGSPSLGSGSPTAWGPRTRTCPASSSCCDHRGGPIGGAAELGGRLHAGRLPGDPVPHRGRPDPQPAPRPPASPADASAPSSTCSTTLNDDHLRGPPRRDRAGGPDRSLRAGLPDAGRGPRGRRPLGRVRRDASASTASTTP